MKFILTASIRKAEFESLEEIFPMAALKVAAKKSLEGLGEEIKASVKIPSTRLKKLYLTSTGGAGRALFLLQITSEKTVLIMLRLKNDKQIGSNMTIKNPKFKQALEKNLMLAIKDIEENNYEEINLS